jgi:hypothetical protein
MRRLIPLLLAAMAWPVAAQNRGLVSRLRESGTRLETVHAILYFDPEGLSREEMKAFSALVEQGIVDIGRFLDVSIEADRWPQGKIEYFISGEVGIAGAYTHTVLLPLERVRNRSVPYLHETTHILAPGRTRSLWLTEGLACYVQSSVAENYGGYDGHIFTTAGNVGIDGEAARFLNGDNGPEILNFIAGPGRPRGLYWDRTRVAAPLYVMSHSFVKFLAERAGLAKVKQLLEFEQAESGLEALTGRGGEAWRRAWLEKLQSPGRPKDTRP